MKRCPDLIFVVFNLQNKNVLNLYYKSFRDFWKFAFHISYIYLFIFYFFSGQIKLADFGLARLYNSEERYVCVRMTLTAGCAKQL